MNPVGIVGTQNRGRELVGDVPRMATVEDKTGFSILESARPHAKQNSYSRLPNVQHKINLKTVADALIDAGLDPAIEIARILKGVAKINPDTGDIEVDPLTGEPIRVHLVDEEVRLRTFNSLLEFNQPKLKAMEVKVTTTDMPTEQLDQRIKALLAKVNI